MNIKLKIMINNKYSLRFIYISLLLLSRVPEQPAQTMGRLKWDYPCILFDLFIF